MPIVKVELPSKEAAAAESPRLKRSEFPDITSKMITYLSFKITMSHVICCYKGFSSRINLHVEEISDNMLPKCIFLFIYESICIAK